MKKVIEEHGIESELINSCLKRVDFRDTFSTRNQKNSLEEIANLIFNYSPWWLSLLFSIRAALVRVVGIKSEKPDDYNEDFRVGGYVGFFKIFAILDDEILLGLNDKHLNFRVSIKNANVDEYNIKVTTLVEFNNSLGRLYMKVIAPFHRLVVIQLVKRAYGK